MRKPFDMSEPGPTRQGRLNRRGALRALAAPALLLGAGGPAAAQGLLDPNQPLDVTISGGGFRPTPIALPPFISADPALAAVAEEISAVAAGDLQRSGLFEFTPAAPPISIDVPPDFQALRARGAEAALLGEAAQEPDGRLGVRFRLWDVRDGTPLRQLKLLATREGVRRVGHKVADIVYKAVLGQEPYFDSRIVFVEERGPKNDRRKRLAIMDQDGAGLSYLTTDEHIVLTPRFAPKGQEITFISFETGQPEIYLMNLTTKRREALGEVPGMTFAPRFSPSGGQVVLSLTRGAGTDIFAMDLATRRLARLTNSPGIDTAPCYSPDGDRIVFESDRGASQQLYVMNADGSGQTRISYGEGRYATPVWSPDRRHIAFTKMVGGRFHIGVMEVDGSRERLLTSSFLDEGPTWAPNGRVLMFFRETPGAEGRPVLHTVDLFGRAMRKLETPNGASDPAWSPLRD